MKYKCTRCGFEMETEGSTILNFDTQCPKCKEKYGTGIFSSMKPMEEREQYND